LYLRKSPNVNHWILSRIDQYLNHVTRGQIHNTQKKKKYPCVAHALQLKKNNLFQSLLFNMAKNLVFCKK